MDSAGSATVSDTDLSQSDWTLAAGQTVASQCPSTADSHGAVSRFDDGLTMRSSKCVTGSTARMTAVVTDCQGITYSDIRGRIVLQRKL